MLQEGSRRAWEVSEMYITLMGVMLLQGLLFFQSQQMAQIKYVLSVYHLYLSKAVQNTAGGDFLYFHSLRPQGGKPMDDKRTRVLKSSFMRLPWGSRG